MTVTPRSLSTTLFQYMVIVFWALCLGLGLAWIVSEVRVMRADAVVAEQEYVDQQKHEVQVLINRLVNDINGEIDRSRATQEKELQQRVDQATALATHFWEAQKGTRPRAHIINSIREALRSLRYDDGAGYYFIFDLEGREVLNADHPETEGQDMLSRQDPEGRLVVPEILDLVAQQGEGIYRYLWSKPNSDGTHHAKTSYFRLFEPLGLVIGTGLYDEDFTRGLQASVLDRVRQIRFGDNGYVFVNSYDGHALVIRSDRFAAGDDIWELEDPTGLKVIQEERRAVAHPEGDFIYYHWSEPGRSEPVEKASFIQGIERWQWMIGAGVHLQDLETVLAQRRKAAQGVIVRAVLQILIAFAAALLLSTFLARRFSRRIRKDLDTLGTAFEKAVADHQEIDSSGLGYVEFRGFAGSMNEMIAERRSIEADLLKARNLESIGVLAGGIAHDFNNLLTAILGNISLAREDLAELPETDALLSRAEGVSHRARDLSQQLLAFARGGAPVRSLEDLSEILRETATFSLLGSNVELNFVLPDEMYRAEVDAGQFSQLVSNLTLNASQAMPGGGTLTIIARNRDLSEGNGLKLPPGAYVALEFRDTGVGIPTEDLDRIFDPYFTTRREGTGLGLSSVYAIVKNHGGAIHVETDPGHGTVFRLWIPARPGAQPLETIQRRTEGPLPQRVLLMEDDESVAAVGVRMLEHIGCEAELAENGEQALAMYEREKSAGHGFDVVIMDLTIRGGMGGQEAVGELLQCDPDACVIVSSGYSNDPVMSDYRRYGFRAMIRKPYSLENLRDVLAGLRSSD